MLFAHRRLSGVLAVLVLAGAAGCATPREDGVFDVTLVNISAPQDGGGLGEAALNFTIRLQNGSPEPITVEGGAHKIYLNGVYVGQGLHNQTVSVPRLGTLTQEVPVYLSTFRLARSFYRMFHSHTISYRLSSTVYGDQGGHRQKFRAAKEGTVKVDELTTPQTPEWPAAVGPGNQ
jgi:hypothetical protein